MGDIKRLTEMQKKFAHELVSNEGRKYAYQCAIDAGYSKDRSRQTAYELCNPKIHPLVEDESPPIFSLATVKSPKSAAFPCD